MWKHHYPFNSIHYQEGVHIGWLYEPQALKALDLYFAVHYKFRELISFCTDSIGMDEFVVTTYCGCSEYFNFDALVYRPDVKPDGHQAMTLDHTSEFRYRSETVYVQFKYNFSNNRIMYRYVIEHEVGKSVGDFIVQPCDLPRPIIPKVYNYDYCHKLFEPEHKYLLNHFDFPMQDVPMYEYESYVTGRYRSFQRLWSSCSEYVFIMGYEVCYNPHPGDFVSIIYFEKIFDAVASVLNCTATYMINPEIFQEVSSRVDVHPGATQDVPFYYELIKIYRLLRLIHLRKSGVLGYTTLFNLRQDVYKGSRDKILVVKVDFSQLSFKPVLEHKCMIY